MDDNQLFKSVFAILALTAVAVLAQLCFEYGKAAGKLECYEQTEAGSQ